MAKMYDPVELKAFGETFLGDPILKMGFLAVLRNAPSVEAEHVRHAAWVSLEPEIGLLACSECDHRILRAKCNYCPGCGAKMDGERR